MFSLRKVLACFCVVMFMGAALVEPAFAKTGAAEQKTVMVTVNINNASAIDLAAKLIGIGKTKAMAIVKYRKDHGAFSSKEQLLNVKGIGDSTLKKNRALIVL